MRTKLVFILALFCSNFIVIFTQNNSGNSYYFKVDKNNDIKILKRVRNLNHNITDYDYSHGRNRKNKPSNVEIMRIPVPNKPVVTMDPEKFFLDHEWDYNHKDIDKSKLPKFLDEFYKNFDGNTVRILFNSNRNSSDKIIKFNLESIKENDNISLASMFLYWPLKENSTFYKTSVVLRLYQVQINSGVPLNESYLLENPDVHKLSNAIYISKAQKGWQAFTIRKPVQNWIVKKEPNLGLILTISSYGDNNKPLQIFNDTNEGVFRTFTMFSMKQNKTYNKNETTIHDKEISKHCIRKPWFINFKNLFWDRFIIRPEDGYNIYECVGSCNRIEDNQKNHAKFTNIFGKSSCCAPNSYHSLPIMYFDKYENIAIKQYDNMVVDSCSCR